LAEDVEDGAYVFLTVFYWNIKILESKTDLCEQVSKVDLECPLKAGKTTITKEVALPDQIPPVSTLTILDSFSNTKFFYRVHIRFMQMPSLSTRSQLSAWKHKLAFRNRLEELIERFDDEGCLAT
jgi:hypothetical protein